MAETDPMWFIVSQSNKRASWRMEDFLSLGTTDAKEFLGAVEALSIDIAYGSLLDFGCGLGRLSIALAPYFSRVIGADISPRMVHQAQTLATSLGCENVGFVLSADSELQQFPDEHFDVVYCNGVLQHLPDQELQRMYISSFQRVLRPGGILFLQLPTKTKLLGPILARRRPYRMLRKLGVSAAFLHGRLHLHEMHMTAFPEDELLKLLTAQDMRCVRIDRPNARNRQYYAVKDDAVDN